eukprot:s2080_g5.t1
MDRRGRRGDSRSRDRRRDPKRPAEPDHPPRSRRAADPPPRGYPPQGEHRRDSRDVRSYSAEVSEGRPASKARPAAPPRRVALGQTSGDSGVTAAGAWAARWEIADMLEEGCDVRELIGAIRSGRGGHRVLEMGHLLWEVFLSQEEQDRMERSEAMPKSRNELVLSKTRPSCKKRIGSDRSEPPVEVTSDMEVMRKRLEFRARASALVGLSHYNSYRTLHDRHCSKLLGEVPEGMRPPTIQEVRRFDRTLHQELLRWLSREIGTMDNGLSDL